MGGIRIIPIPFSDEVRPRDSLPDTLIGALKKGGVSLAKDDVLVVKHKIVSKAEGQLVRLETIRPSAASRAWARKYKLDARVTELALRESKRVIKRKNGVLITETRHGFICANSGVDISNVDGGEHALLLPKNPYRSA